MSDLPEYFAPKPMPYGLKAEPMSDFTPITNRIRKAWITYRIRKSFRTAPEASREFDRWLAEHDRQERAEAWENGYDAGVEDLRDADGWRAVVNPYRKVSK